MRTDWPKLIGLQCRMSALCSNSTEAVGAIRRTFRRPFTHRDHMTDILTSQSGLSDVIMQPSGDEPYISVIVPVRNEEKYIEGTLCELMSQAYPKHRFEIIVVDGCSTDNTAEIIRGLQKIYSNLMLVDNPRQRSSAGRNVGIRKSRGEIVVIVDGHCQLESENYLLNLADAFHRSGADCIGRPQPIDVSRATTLQRAIAAARSSWLGHHTASYIYSDREQFVPPQSVAVAYRKKVFDEVGLFDENFDACEDVEFNHRVDRAGLKCFLTPKIALRYFPRSSISGLFRQLYRYGRGRARLLRKHPRTFGPATVIPALFVLWLITLPLMAIFFPTLWIGWFLGIAVYAMTLLVTSQPLRFPANRPCVVGSRLCLQQSIRVRVSVFFLKCFPGSSLPAQDSRTRNKRTNSP